MKAAPKKLNRTGLKKAGCHSCENSRAQVTLKTHKAITHGLVLGNKKEKNKHQKIS